MVIFRTDLEKFTAGRRSIGQQPVPDIGVGTGILIVSYDSKQSGAEWRGLRYAYVVLVQCELRRRIVGIFHIDPNRYFSVDARNAVRGAHHQVVLGVHLVIQLVDNVNQT